MTSTMKWMATLCVSLTVGMLANGCSGCGSSSDTNPSSSASSAGGGGMGGSGGGLGLDGGPVGGGGGDGSTIDPDAACAQSSTEATLVPVNMFVMFDRSGSMDDNLKWVNATSAMKAFFQDPATAGLRVALRFFPDDVPVAGCNGQACSIGACSVPLVGLAPLLVDLAPIDVQEAALVAAIDAAGPNGGTPMSAALGGAEQWAVAYKAANPTEMVVVVLITDGMPNGCDEDITNISNLAAAANGSGVLTYAVGLQGSSEAQMDQIAQAGGTQQGFFIGNGNAEADLLAALKAIQGSSVACSFDMPVSSDPNKPVDPEKVNVNYTPGGGTEMTLGQVDGPASCAGGGWYYDDPAAPTEIILCPTTCATIQADTGAKIEILLGCTTVIGPPA